MMKHSRWGIVTLAAVLGCAAYFRSWLLLMIALFVFGVEYAAQEFDEMKERLTRIEAALQIEKR